MVDPEKKWIVQQHRIENVLGKGWMSFVSRVLNTSLYILPYKMLKNVQLIFPPLTVAVPEIWDILEIQKMKICSEVPNFMGKMNFRSKCG